MIARSSLILSLLLTLPLATAALADDGHDHGKGHDTAAETKHHAEKSFATPKDAWSFLKEKIAVAETSAAEKKLEPIHELAEQMQGAVLVLEGKVDAVPEASRTRLTSALKQLKKGTDELHHGAEDNDMAQATAAIIKIKGLLPLIAGLYPAGTIR